MRAKALIAAANLAVNQVDYERAEALCQESLALCRELGDQAGIAYSLYLLAWVARDRDNFSAARSFVEEALALFRDLGDKENTVWSLFALASLDTIQGEYTRACALLEESLTLFREQGNKIGLAWSLYSLAQARLESQADPAIVHSLLEESLVLWRELGDPRGTAYAVFLSGQVAFRQGDVATARSLAEESVRRYKEIGDRQGIAISLILLARVVSFQGDHTAARRVYEEGLATARETNHKWVIASCLEGLASIVAAQEQVGIPLVEIPPGEQVIMWAAQLWGAAEALREAVGVPIPFVERADYERSVSAARTQLGEEGGGTHNDTGAGLRRARTCGGLSRSRAGDHLDTNLSRRADGTRGGGITPCGTRADQHRDRPGVESERENGRPSPDPHLQQDKQ